jgi:hypothetical protein
VCKVRKAVSILFALVLALSLCLMTAVPVMAQTANFVPISGPVGTTITVTGAAWTALEVINPVTVGGIAATHTLTVDGAGALSGTITVPTVAVGLKDIVITGATSGARTFAGAFTVTTATANFVPISGPVGTTITVTGTGWAPSDTIAVGAVTVGGVVAVHTLTVDGTGALSGTITVPAQADGLKDIVITGATSGARTFANAFTVALPVSGGGGATASGVGSINLTRYLDWQGKTIADISLTSTDGLVTMGIHWGTLLLDAQGTPLESIEINILSTPPPPPGYALVGHAYDCLPAGATFQPAILLTFRYRSADIPDGVSEQDLVLAYWDGGEWVNLPTTVNVANNTVAARAAHFTPFAILAYTGAPAFGTSDLSITPAEVDAGEEVTISLLAANTGDLAGSYEVTLEIDNMVVTTEAVTLAAGASERVTFTTAKDVAGTYAVSVGGLSGTFVVKQAAPPPAAAPPPETAPPEGEEAQPLNIWIIVGIIAAVIVVFLIIFMLSRRRRA